MLKLTPLLVLLTILMFEGGCSPSASVSIPAIIEGDSMAPTICGDHLMVTCLDCQIEFVAELAPNGGGDLTCPNCGFRKISSEDATRVPTSEVELQSFSKFPRRWEIVGFELPSDAQKKTGIKRIVGLPGETIEIQNGDLYSRGKILRKPWALQKEIRIPVFDSKFNAIAPYGNTARFVKAQEDSGWRVGSDLRFMSKGDGTDWLDYVHWRNCVRPGQRNKPVPIEDSYGFNQSLARELNPMDDVMVRLDVDFEVDSTMSLAFRRGKAEFEFEIAKSEKEFSISWSGASNRKPLVYKSLLPEELPAGTIEFSSFDRSVMLRVNGQQVFEIREDESDSPESEESNFEADSMSVFRIGGKRGSFRINRARIWRDIFYLKSPNGYQAPESVKLSAGSGEYILLGDNSPKSLDSRIWKKAGIDRRMLIGRLLRDAQSN